MRLIVVIKTGLSSKKFIPNFLCWQANKLKFIKQWSNPLKPKKIPQADVIHHTI
jgi:hypothetical protein